MELFSGRFHGFTTRILIKQSRCYGLGFLQIREPRSMSDWCRESTQDAGTRKARKHCNQKLRRAAPSEAEMFYRVLPERSTEDRSDIHKTSRLLGEATFKGIVLP